MAESSSGSNSRRQNMNGVRKETHDKCLDAIKEDLAAWFNRLLGTAVTLETFSSTLETGVVLCQLANLIQAAVEDYVVSHPDGVYRAHGHFPRSGVTFKKRTGFPGSFIARDNVANFIRWCRELGVPDTIMFESDDVVMEKNEKRVILTLLEVARRAARFGVDPPDLIRLENEIEQEMDRDQIAADAQAQEHVILSNSKLSRKKSHSLDDLVYQVLEQCTCEPVKYQVVRIAEGKYRMGEQKTLIFVRIMRKNVMVRVGGGWDTLERYFDKHDPCRMQEHARRRNVARSPRCHGNGLFSRSPSSLSVGSVSSTDSQDSFNTATTTSSSSILSGTWPAQSIKPPREGAAKSRPPSSSPNLGQSRLRKAGASPRKTPPRTIDTQARNRRSKSMHELSKLSVETVMGPTYAKQTNSSLRKQSVGALDKPGPKTRRQSVISAKTVPGGRDSAPQMSFSSSVSRSSSFGASPRPGSGDRTRARSVGRPAATNGPSLGSPTAGDRSSSSGALASGDRTRARSVSRIPSRNGPPSSGSFASGDRTRARSVNRTASSNELVSRTGSGLSLDRAVEGDRSEKGEVKDEGQRKVRSRVAERDARSGSARRGRSTPRESGATTGQPRARSSTLPQEAESETLLQRQKSKTSQRERSKTPHRQSKDQAPQRKISKMSGPHGKPTNKMVAKSQDTRPSGSMSDRQKESREPDQEPFQTRTEGKDREDSKSPTSNYSRIMRSSEEFVQSSGPEGREMSPVRGERHPEVNDERAVRLLYETLLNSKDGLTTANGPLLVEGIDGKTIWYDECLRNVRVIDFSETGPQSSEKLDINNWSPDDEREAWEELHDQAPNPDFRRKPTTINNSNLDKGDRRTTERVGENRTEQIARRRPSDLHLASPASRDAFIAPTAPPNPKEREIEPDYAPSSNRARVMYFDVEQYSRNSADSDSASTPESSSDSPRKPSLVQSMISSIESRTKHDSNVSPCGKQSAQAALTAKETPGKLATKQTQTCAKEEDSSPQPVGNNITDRNKYAFYPSRSADDILQVSHDKNSDVFPANYSSTPELSVAGDGPTGGERPSWKTERRKDSLEGSKERYHSVLKKAENFPRPQKQFTLEEMIEDMLPQDKGNVLFGTALPHSLVPKHE